MKVYVAGPDVFRKDAKAYLEFVRKMLEFRGVEALIPLDNEVTAGPPNRMLQEIYEGNVAMIDRCDVVLANITPFRGAHMDPGTAFEVGYAVARGKKVYCYTPHAHDPLFKRFDRTTATMDEGVVRDSDGNAIEDLGETENLMIVAPSRCVVSSLVDAVRIMLDEQARGE